MQGGDGGSLRREGRTPGSGKCGSAASSLARTERHREANRTTIALQSVCEENN